MSSTNDMPRSLLAAEEASQPFGLQVEEIVEFLYASSNKRVLVSSICMLFFW